MKKNMVFGILLGIGIGLVLFSGFDILYLEQKMQVSPDFIKSEAKKLGMIEPSEYINKKQIQTGNLAPDFKNIIIVEIPDGASDEKVASILKEKKLIESEEAFIKKINEKNIQKNFQAGRFEFTDTDTIEDIIKKIMIVN